MVLVGEKEAEVGLEGSTLYGGLGWGCCGSRKGVEEILSRAVGDDAVGDQVCVALKGVSGTVEEAGGAKTGALLDRMRGFMGCGMEVRRVAKGDAVAGGVCACSYGACCKCGGWIEVGPDGIETVFAEGALDRFAMGQRMPATCYSFGGCGEERLCRCARMGVARLLGMKGHPAKAVADVADTPIHSAGVSVGAGLGRRLGPDSRGSRDWRFLRGNEGAHRFVQELTLPKGVRQMRKAW